MSKVLYSGFIILLTMIIQIAKSQEPAPANIKMQGKQPAFQHYYKELPPYFLADKSNLDKINEVTFTVVDSLANAFSFYSNEQQPIVYSPKLNQLIMIKRGALSEVAQTNNLNNMFFRTSTDWGKTWTNPVLLYDYNKFSTKNRMARYPSIYGFEYDGAPAYIYTFPVTDGSSSNGWKGFINGLYTTETFNSYSEKIGSKTTYTWGTNSKILGRSINTSDLFALAFGSVTPTTEGLTDNNNLAYRRTEQFDDWGGTIPAAWASDKFFDVDLATYRRSGMIGLKFGKNNEILAAVFGGFEAMKDVDSSNTVAVSKSVDDGKTWSEFDICPYALVETYAQAEGYNINKTYISWDGKDFVSFDNGDFSMAVNLVDGDTTIPIDDRKLQFIEIYNESGVWGVRKIADHGPYVLRFIDDNGQLDTNDNQVGYELQMVRTVDGNNVIAKWVDFVDVYDEVGDSLIKNATTDIMVCVREQNVAKKNWGKVINVSQDIPYDRVTWLPDLVPNSMKDVPVLRLRTKPVAGETAADARLNERKMGASQFVTYGFFDASLSLGVEEHKFVNSDIKISPNPAGEKFSLTFTLREQGNVKIKIYNANGIFVKDVYNSFVGEGLRGMEINTESLVSGAYYCTMEYLGTVQKCNLIICK